MENKYQYDMYYMNPYYMKQSKTSYPFQNIFGDQCTNMLERPTVHGFIRLIIVDRSTGELLPNSGVTIYVTDGEQRDIPILHLVTIINPIRLELPVACRIGTHLRGPEYDFSTYNLRVDVFGYFANVLYNIRLFPNVTTDFRIEMIPITQVRLDPTYEERIQIPPHPRDVMMDKVPSPN